MPWEPPTSQETDSHQESAHILTLDFPASRTAREKCLVFKPPSLWPFVIASRTQTEVMSYKRFNLKKKIFHDSIVILKGMGKKKNTEKVGERKK